MTEHISLESGPHPDEWRDGATCQDCQIAYEMRRMELRNQGPNWNLQWLKNSNEMGMSARAFQQEIFDEAKRTGRDIRHVGGSTKARQERNKHYGTGG